MHQLYNEFVAPSTEPLVSKLCKKAHTQYAQSIALAIFWKALYKNSGSAVELENHIVCAEKKWY
jgi:hypothetical protein